MADQEPKAVWKMPVVEVGDPVLFSRDLSDRKVYPGLVVAVYNSTIDMLIAGAGYTARNQVRHKSDPLLVNRQDLIEDSGVFELAPMTLRLRALEQAVADQAVDIAKLKRPTESAVKKV